MIEFLAAGIFFIILSLILIYRVAIGPSNADRVVAGKGITMLLTLALIVFSVYSGRGIYLDIAIVIAIFGIIGTLLLSSYLEEKL